MANPKGDFIWYELMTSDGKAAKSFYDEVIGWNIQGHGSPTPTGATYHMIGRSDGKFAGGMLELTEEMQQQGISPGWFGYIHVPDVDETLDRLTAAGASVVMPASQIPDVGRIALVADPWGATFYVMTPTPPADDPDAASDVFSVEQPQHVRWNQLQTTNPAGAIALYCDLFGWSQEGAMPMGDLGDYSFIQNGGTGIGAIMPKMDDVAQPVWSYFIGVDDIDRAARAVESGGGRLDSPLQQIPGGEYSVHCFDPQGAGFGLVGPRKEA